MTAITLNEQNPSMYIEYSIMSMRPAILDFLTKMLGKAEQVANSAFSLTMKNKDLAELAGKDTRTVSRYLNTLEEKNVIEKKGIRGRGGGTVILFNSDLIRFDNNDQTALINSEPVSLDSIVEEKKPKPKKKKEPTRYRRTAREMAEARILQDVLKTEHDKFNQRIVENGGTPSWEMFQDTPDPKAHYTTYLLSRVYNRYAILFTDRQNHDADVHKEGNNVGVISPDYDVLPTEFFGSARYKQFDDLRIFCEENRLDPILYLSAQFSRSVFTASNRGHKKPLPFVNAMVGDNGYKIYMEHVKYQTKFSLAHNFSGTVPPQFVGDTVIKAIRKEFQGRDRKGFMNFRTALSAFFTDEGVILDHRFEALVGFYQLTKRNLKESGIAKQSQEVIKKFLLSQSLIHYKGASGISSPDIVASEPVRLILKEIEKAVAPHPSEEHQGLALGALLYPKEESNVRRVKGTQVLESMQRSKESYKVLDLIQDRQETRVSVAELQKALQEYGVDKIPLDQFSSLDINAIVEFMEKNFGIKEIEVIDPKEYTERKPHHIGEFKQLPNKVNQVALESIAEIDSMIGGLDLS